MEITKSNASFGMAYRSPGRLDMPYFKKFMAQETGKLDTKAFGEFIIRQSENENAHIRYIRSKIGDMLEVFSAHNPKEIVKIPIGKSPKYKNFIDKVRQWLSDKNIKYEYDPQGNLDNLPVELKKAGEIADKMNKLWAK